MIFFSTVDNMGEKIMKRVILIEKYKQIWWFWYEEQVNI